MGGARLLLCLAVAATAGVFLPGSAAPAESVEALYAAWARRFQVPPAADGQEQAARLAAFRATLARLKTANRSAESLNGLAAMDSAAFDLRNAYNASGGLYPAGLLRPGLLTDPASPPGPPHPPGPPGRAPKEWDWRDHDAVTAIKDQDQCGACWAVAAVEVIESAAAIQSALRPEGSRLEAYSVQELVSCDELNNGCKGGNTQRAREFLMQHGLMTEQAYPWQGKVPAPACLGMVPRQVQVLGMSELSTPDGRVLPEAAWPGYLHRQGPLAVAVDAREWQDYSGGMLDSTSCGTIQAGPNHAVVLVGYGTDADGRDYWLVRNSWGTHWGINGYALIPRGRGCFEITFQAPVTFSVVSEREPPHPSECDKFSSCDQCVQQPECGFCAHTGECSHGNVSHPSAGGCSSEWLYDSCPSCPAEHQHDKGFSLTILLIISIAALLCGIAIGLMIGACIYKCAKNRQQPSVRVVPPEHEYSFLAQHRTNQGPFEAFIPQGMPSHHPNGVVTDYYNGTARAEPVIGQAPRTVPCARVAPKEPDTP